jgi:DNA-directed RNA polymerase beta subunit
MNKQPELRSFDDPAKTREWLLDGAMSALSTRFPIEDNEYKLELADVHVKPVKYGLERQKRALLNDEKLRIPVKGTWKLVHKPTNEVLDTRKDTVLHLPYITDRGTIIHKGNEYSSVNQSRLKPGVYTRHKKSGEYESFVNVKPGSGRTFRVWLEPSTGVFKVNVGQSNIPLYPLMGAMGFKDDELKERWGEDILNANKAAKAPQALEKLYKRFVRYNKETPVSDQERNDLLVKAITDSKVDRFVTAKTLGIDDDHITPGMMLGMTNKLLGVSRGDSEPDDRDAPQYSNVLSVEDFIEDRISNDAGKVARSLLYKARRDRSLKRVPASALDPYTDEYVYGSRLTMPLEETNPLALLEQMGRVTKMGEGGIGDAEAITDEARNVNLGQLGFIDPINGPEDTKIGIDTRASYNTFKGRDRQMYGEFLDAKTGKITHLRPEDLDGKVLAYPGELGRKDGMAVAVKGGSIQEVPHSEVDLAVPSLGHMLSPNTNLNPMPTAVQPARQFYGAKFWSQYMPLKDGDAPLVVTGIEGTDDTFSQKFGRSVGAITADRDMVVSSVRGNKVILTDENGDKQEVDLVQNFPFNRISGISYRSAVTTGQKVKKGDVIARSNFVSDDDSIRLGKNLSVAVIPYKGHSFEDSLVISESAAKKMTTERLYGVDVEARHGVKVDKNRYASLFSDKFSADQMKKIDDNGVVKPGTILKKGDPIILATGPKLMTAEDAQLGKLHKVLRNANVDKAEIWDHEYDGEVVDAVMTRSGAKVNIKAAVPARIGDKMSPSQGLKGVIGHIIPDDKMPRNAATNEPYDLLLNPMTILSRIAANSLIEMQLGKLAKHKGERIVLPQLPPEEGWNEWARNQLKEAGLEEKDVIFDPDKGRNLRKPVATGVMHWMAFHHLAEKKLSDRGAYGMGYTMDELPAKGGMDNQQAKRMSTMDSYQLLAHGATEVLRDSQTIRGAKNENYWKALKLGRPLPEPEVPFVYNKFLNLLKASGINPVQNGDTIKLMPLLDSDVDSLSRGEIKSGEMLNDKLSPIAGGLFDPGATGGAMGKFWSHIKLSEPLPNPVFEEPIRRLLGLRQKDFNAIVAGEQELNGKTGGAAIKEALSNVDINKEIEKQKVAIKQYRGANRDNAVKKLGYLSAAKKTGIHPSQWVMSKVPVIPPVFRPVSRLGDVTIEADINELYRDALEVNSAISELRKDLPESAITSEKAMLYNAVKAIAGLGEPITAEGRAKRLKGGIRTVIGDSPKRGLFQSRVMSKPVDMVGRAVVSPDPGLGMDEVGVPEDAAWGLYKDFVLRRLVRSNIPTDKALKMIEDRDPVAKSAMVEEMGSRPVLMDRAPTWHKFNIMAYRPTLVKGNTLRVNPLVTKSLTMDFDGDQANFHVPVSEEAVAQAYEKMLPSKNLVSLTDLRTPRHTPQQEMALGLYLLTRAAEKKGVKYFDSSEAAKAAYRRGEIGPNDPIEIRGL